MTIAYDSMGLLDLKVYAINIGVIPREDTDHRDLAVALAFLDAVAFAPVPQRYRGHPAPRASARVGRPAKLVHSRYRHLAEVPRAAV